MLCLQVFGTHASTQKLPHFCAFPASFQERSPPKCLFFMANAKLPNHPGFALPHVQNSEGREWGVGSVVVESAVLGRPDFHSRGPKTRGVPSDGLRRYGLSILKTIREIRGPNASKTRLKCTCHETALSVTRQTCTWNYPENPYLEGFRSDFWRAKIWGAPNADPTTTAPMPPRIAFSGEDEVDMLGSGDHYETYHCTQNYCRTELLLCLKYVW